MIRILESCQASVAKQIYQIFQRSYKIEAELVGVDDFPPLQRTIEQIVDSKNRFYGLFEGQALAAVIEVTCQQEVLDIRSLTVDPEHFRKGIAGKLMSFVIDNHDFTKALVETAAVNQPAIALYQKHGFTLFKQWVPFHGIEKVALSLIKKDNMKDTVTSKTLKPSHHKGLR